MPCVALWRKPALFLDGPTRSRSKSSLLVSERHSERAQNAALEGVQWMGRRS